LRPFIGKEEQAPVISRGELEIFAAGLKLVEQGRKDQAQGLFRQFMEEFPQSPLSGDAQKVLEVLQAEAEAAF
jgi:TolA-binding protein